MGIETPPGTRAAAHPSSAPSSPSKRSSAVDPAGGVMVDVQNTLTVNAILNWGTELQTQTWLPRLATDTICSHALSEAASGSDAFALQTTARKKDDSYILRGSQALNLKRRRGRPLHRLHQHRPDAGLQRHHRIPGRARHLRLHDRQEGRQARHPCLIDLPRSAAFMKELQTSRRPPSPKHLLSQT